MLYQVYAVSGDSVQSHKQWLPSLQCPALSIPVLSDAGHVLSNRWGLSNDQETGGEGETVTNDGGQYIVITDNEAVMLEVISTSMTVDQLVNYSR